MIDVQRLTRFSVATQVARRPAVVFLQRHHPYFIRVAGEGDQQGRNEQGAERLVPNNIHAHS
jgi:hypothetical protein